MSVEAANSLGISVAVLDKWPNPAVQVSSSAEHVDADFKSTEGILTLASKCDILTVEIEHVNVDAMEQAAEKYPNLQIHPSTKAIRIIQDKFAQKEYLKSRNIPLSEYQSVENTIADIQLVGESYGYPFLLKSRRLAYDGRGNYVVRSRQDVPDGYAALGSGKLDLYAERFVSFEKELAVMVVRNADATCVRAYPTVETVQKDNICKLVIAPAQIPQDVAARAQEIAKTVVAAFDGAGVYGVELFLQADGSILFNEVAPRPHNSGHYSLEACYTSQFENHIRAVSGLPLGSCDMKVEGAVMVNILGQETSALTLAPCKKALALPGASVYMYGKGECRKGRKMGHINICRSSLKEALDVANMLLPAEEARTSDGAVVGIIMGSDSDLNVMKPAAQILEDFGVPFELTVVSAHRTPARMCEYAKSAKDRGIKVIVAAAGMLPCLNRLGGAAHLPGMVAAQTPLPVIGVPVALKFLDGVDSLHSIVQMPV
ncbi:MAG: hypothetical protein SGCHY_003415 [Lobulomycetales sp.]